MIINVVQTGYSLRITHTTTFKGKCNETNMLKDAIPVLFDRNCLHHVSEHYLGSKSDLRTHENCQI